jgi:NitT/TauT family transport system substrate-binding protein
VFFIPQWAPQVQFAGYYVAHKHSPYGKYGIDLTIVPGGPEGSPGDFLKNHKDDFVTLWLSSGIQMLLLIPTLFEAILSNYFDTVL